MRSIELTFCDLGKRQPVKIPEKSSYNVHISVVREEMVISRLIYLTVFWTALAFAFTMAIIPHPPPLLGNMWDKAQHALAFAVLTALALLAYQGVRPIQVALLLSVFGALIEVVQATPFLHRDSDYKDWVADTLAIFIVLLVRMLGVRLRSTQ